MPRPVTVRPVSEFLQALATVALIVFVLWAAKPVVIPIALAVLASFILTPIVGLWERRLGLGRIPVAMLTLVLTAVVLAGTGWMVTTQALSLARELPEHKVQIQKKIDGLRGSGGPLTKFFDMVKELGDGTKEKTVRDTREPDAPDAPTTVGGPPAPPRRIEEGSPAADAKVVVGKVQEGSPIARLAESAEVVVAPLATAGLVCVLTAFMLILREDLRDRVIGAVGQGQLLGATRVLSESAEKVSKFLLFQLAVNAGFGLILTIGLLVLGVSYAPLWGFLSMLLRFIPYVGTWISALFPFALSFAMSPDWTQPLLVFGFFAVLDLITANVVEPLLFGHHTGVSPLALLISVAFFTWIWGPIGLLLSTPITVCLAVIGANVPKLRPLAMLLGDQPALPVAVRYYQRLLSKDQTGAASVVEPVVKEDGLAAAYDAVVIPALGMACRDKAAGRLSPEEEQGVFESTAVALNEATVAPNLQPKVAEPPLSPLRGVVIGASAQRSAEGLPLRMLAQVVGPEGCRVEIAPTQLLPAQVEQLVADTKAVAVVVSVLPPGGLPQAAYLCRRLRKRFPDLPIVVAYWGPAAHYDKLLNRLRKAGVSSVTTSLAQTCSQVRAAMPKPKPTGGKS